VSPDLLDQLDPLGPVALLDPSVLLVPLVALAQLGPLEALAQQGLKVYSAVIV